LLEPSVHRRKAVAYAASASETESPLARMSNGRPRCRLQSRGAPARTSRIARATTARTVRGAQSATGLPVQLDQWLSTPSASPWLALAWRIRAYPRGPAKKRRSPHCARARCFHPRPRGRVS
jgi:hypothetical protein